MRQGALFVFELLSVYRTIEGIRFPRCTHTANNGGQWQRAGGLEMRDRYERRDRKIGKNYTKVAAAEKSQRRWMGNSITEEGIHIHALNKNHRRENLRQIHTVIQTNYVFRKRDE